MTPRKIQERLGRWRPRWRPMRFRAMLVGMVASAFVLPLALLAIPYLDILNDMAVQPKGKPQGTYGPHGRGVGGGERAMLVERPPVPGTIPVGFHPYHLEGNDAEAAKRAGEVLRNPLRPTMEVLRRGREIFESVCIVCHGERAEGNGRIVGPNLFPAPPSLHTDAARAFPDGRIFHVITRGQNKMPSYADRLDPEERWSVVHYVRALQRAKQIAPRGNPR